MIRRVASQGGWGREGGMDLCCVCPPFFLLLQRVSSSAPSLPGALPCLV